MVGIAPPVPRTPTEVTNGPVTDSRPASRRGDARWVLLLGLLLGCAEGQVTLGSPPAKEPLTPIEQIVAEPGQTSGQPVVLQARIGTVCPISGCWCTLTGGTSALKVEFVGFTIPRSAQAAPNRSPSAAAHQVGRGG